MTTKPELAPDLDIASGVAAVALFVAMVAAFVGASFGAPAGFPADASVTASLGYAMFDITGPFVPIEGEGMLAAFEIIDVVLAAALVAAVMLARREGEDGLVTALLTDGGTADAGRSLTRRLRDAVADRDDDEGGER